MATLLSAVVRRAERDRRLRATCPCSEVAKEHSLRDCSTKFLDRIHTHYREVGYVDSVDTMLEILLDGS
jgi:hypothetical protein